MLDLVDVRTNKVFRSFRSESDYLKWSKNISRDLLADFTVKIRSVPWYEDNWELAKLALPVVIGHIFDHPKCVNTFQRSIRVANSPCLL